MNERIQIRIAKDFAGYQTGETFTLDSSEGIPVDPYWQRRLRDSEQDNCCELVVADKAAKATKQNADKGAKQWHQ